VVSSKFIKNLAPRRAYSFAAGYSGLTPGASSLALTSEDKRVLIALVSSHETSYTSRAWVTSPKSKPSNARRAKQWYINFPSAVAQALDFAQSEEVEWTIHDKGI